MGVKTTEYVVIPLLEQVKKMMAHYIKNVDIDSLTGSDLMKKMSYQTNALCLIKSIEDHELDSDIVRHMGPHLHFKKDLLDSSFLSELDNSSIEF